MDESVDRLRRSLRGNGLIAFGVVAPLISLIAFMVLAWNRLVVWQDCVLLLIGYLYTAHGVTIGFHRYLTHRGFTTSTLGKLWLLTAGSLAAVGPAIEFVANHRKHHALADKVGDPHSPVDGFLHAHVGWLFIPVRADISKYAADLLESPMVVWISKPYFYPLWLLLSLIIPLYIGFLYGHPWHGLLIGGGVRIGLVHHVTWSVNSVGHRFGKRPFQTPDLSRNEWIVGLLALGEGWHNNHHAFPRSAFHGLRWWQVDLSGWMILALEKARLVSQVQRVTSEQIAERLRRQLERPQRLTA